MNGFEFLTTLWKFSMLISSARASDFVYVLNSEISDPPQNAQVLLLDGTLFWHWGFRQRAMGQMLTNWCSRLPTKPSFSDNRQPELRDSGGPWGWISNCPELNSPLHFWNANQGESCLGCSFCLESCPTSSFCSISSECNSRKYLQSFKAKGRLPK